jgi:hypothetical protein
MLVAYGTVLIFDLILSAGLEADLTQILGSTAVGDQVYLQ